MYQFNTIKNIDLNGGPDYRHRIQDMTLFITIEDKIIIELDDIQIIKMLEALGIATNDFKKGFYNKEINETY